MIEETGLVRKVEGRRVWIETQVKTTCGSCHVSDNCGTSVVAKAFTNKPDLLELEAPIDLVVGQRVKLGIPENQLLISSMLVYLFPLGLLILIVALLNALVPNLHEGIQILAGFAGFGFGFAFLNRKFKKGSAQQFTPLVMGAVNDDSKIKKHEIPLKKLV